MLGVIEDSRYQRTIMASDANSVLKKSSKKLLSLVYFKMEFEGCQPRFEGCEYGFFLLFWEDLLNVQST